MRPYWSADVLPWRLQPRRMLFGLYILQVIHSQILKSKSPPTTHKRLYLHSTLERPPKILLPKSTCKLACSKLRSKPPPFSFFSPFFYSFSKQTPQCQQLLSVLLRTDEWPALHLQASESGRYSVYLLYWHKRTNTDAAGAQPLRWG